MSQSFINSVILILISALVAAVIASYKKSRDDRKLKDDAMKAQGEATQKQLHEVEKTLAVLSIQMSPLWAQVQSRISNELHHPHPRYAEMDTLLEKLEALTINEAERSRLKVLLEHRAVDDHEDISTTQQAAARIMLEVMPLVQVEAAEVKEVRDKLVNDPQP